MGFSIHIRYGWMYQPLETSRWVEILYKRTRVYLVRSLLLVLIILGLRIFPVSLSVLGIIIGSIILMAAISITMMPRGSSVEIYVEPVIPVNIKDLVVAEPYSIKFLAGASICYTIAFLFTFLAIPLLGTAIFLNSMYIYPFAKKRF